MTERRLLWVAAMAALLALSVPAEADLRLQQFSTRHYVLHSNLPPAEAQAFGRHVDRVFGEYQKLFAATGLTAADTSPMALYLFATQEQYQGFLDGHGVNAANSAGMFFHLPTIRGLATYTRGRSITETMRVLQHEGFHQFAFSYIGVNLPIWVNEGLAQYYEDGIVTDRGMHLGVANARRIATVRRALAQDRVVEFDHLLAMTSEQWGQTLNTNAQQASLLYDQSWSVVYFLIHGDNGRYRRAFEQYLVDLGKNVPSERAFRDAFGTNETQSFRQAWQRFAEQHEPEPLSLTLDRLDFLARAMTFLEERGERVPRRLSDLRARLQAMNYRLIRTTPGGLRFEIAASDESLYAYTRPNGQQAPLVFLNAERPNLLPRISAPGLRPEPTLIWHRDADGQLVHEIVFR
jgi:hypothetical protein